MAELFLAKVVSTLPTPLDANALYLVKVGTGFRPYATNSTGTIVAYGLNPIDWSELTGKPTLLVASNNLSDVAAPATARTNLGLGSAALSSASPIECGRLTLTTGVPVTTADVTGASTIYYTPYVGDVISLYDGTTWTPRVFSELSRTLGSLTSGKNYDVVLYLESGVLTLDLMPAWTDDYTRSSAVSYQNGVLVNTSGFTSARAGHSVSAARAIVIGTIRTTGTSTTECSLAKMFVSNARNRHARQLFRQDTAGSFSYNLTTIRAFRNDAANCLQWVDCLGLDAVRLQIEGAFVPPNAGSQGARLGFGPSPTLMYLNLDSYSVESGNIGLSWDLQPSDVRGYRIYYITQSGTGSGTSTFYYARASGIIQA